MFTPGRRVPTSSICSNGTSPMMLQRHEILRCTLPEDKLGLESSVVSQQPPWPPLSDQPSPILNNYAEKPANASVRMVTWQDHTYDPVETGRSAKWRYDRSRLRRPQHPPPWLVASGDGTTSPTFNYDINGYHVISCISCNNLGTHLQTKEHSHLTQATAPFIRTSPASVFSTNSTDSGYVSALEVAPLTCSPIKTPDLNAATSPLLTEDILLKCCDMPSTSTQLECDEITTSSDAYLADKLKDGIGFVERRVPSTMYGHFPVCSPAMALTGR
jgi:hypothetical protein